MKCELRWIVFAMVVGIGFLTPGSILGQDQSELGQSTNTEEGANTRSDSDLNVYINCNYCDYRFIREKVSFVNHVREQGDSDVHVQVINMRTGGGGDQFEFQFIGRNEFEGDDLEIKFFTSSDESWAEVREVWTQKLMSGLVYYLAKNPEANGFSIVSTRAKNASTAEEVDDPWNYWVFDIDGDGSFQTEESQARYRLGADLSADRITEEWKFNSRIYYNRNRQTFDTDDGEVESISTWKGGYGELVKSLGQHFSAGASAFYEASTFRNRDRNIGFGPSFEYSFFPYAEVSKKQLTLAYHLRASDAKYIETTIFNKDDEMLFRHEIEAELQLIQPDGYARIDAEFSQYLHDLSKNSIELSGRVSRRLFKGFNVNFDAGFEVIHDQLYLPKGDATLEEVLLRQKQLATTFEYSGSIGLSYTFGSIYNNVVNTRL